MVTAAFALAAGWVSTSTADEPAEPLLRCRSIGEAAARLACFDRESAAIAAHRDALRAIPAPPTAGSTPAGSPDPTRQFGLTDKAVAAQEVAAGARAADAARIEAHVVQLTQNSVGRLVVELDNSQVWRQVAADGELLLRKGDAVTIARAALGSFWLSTPSGRGCRVTRVR